MFFSKSDKPEKAGQIALICAQKIFPNPCQPRASFSYDQLQELAASIRQNGLLQPLTVRPFADGTYELVCGERRLRACRLAGIEKIPCVITEMSDEQSAVFALLENIQRCDLNFFEEAAALQKLQCFYGLSQEEIAARLGKSQSFLSNKLRLLRLSEDLRADILSAQLTERHARALLRLAGDQRRQALDMIRARRLTVAETEKLVEQMLRTLPERRREPVSAFRDLTVFINTLNHAVDTMRKAGIAANSAKSETQEYIEYVVRIPKTDEKSRAV